MRRTLFALALVAACGDDLRPPCPDASVAPDARVTTYDDAYTAWGLAYCSFAERCNPAWVYVRYYTEALCAGDVENENCVNDLSRCKSPWPGSLDQIFTCEVDMASLDCAASAAPASCDVLR